MSRKSPRERVRNGRVRVTVQRVPRTAYTHTVIVYDSGSTGAMSAVIYGIEVAAYKKREHANDHARALRLAIKAGGFRSVSAGRYL